MATEETTAEEKIELEESNNVFEGMDLSSLVKQVQNERDFSKKALDAKKTVWRNRLKLYNNQKKEDESVGDPLLFTVMQTVLASLYEDDLAATFEPNNDGDYERAKNVEQLARFDEKKMGLDEHDWDWDWDTCFFGRGITLQRDFDRDQKLPIPEVIDPLTIERDPLATSVNGKGPRRKGAARFIGWERSVVRAELTEEAGFFNLDKLCHDTPEQASQTELDRQARAQAQGRTTQVSKVDLGDNTEYPVFQWFTNWTVMESGKMPDSEDGTEGEDYNYEALRKVEVWLTSDLKHVIRFEVLKDSEGNPYSDWPITDRPLYPTSHDWDGVSIPDLVEDKQRARAAIMNLTLQGLKADMYPMYIYNRNKITNKNDLNFRFNGMVGIDGDANNAILPMNKANIRTDIVNYILDTLDQSAQRATATPDIQQGQVSDQQRTLGELNLVSAKTDTRYTLSTKIWGWSAKRFWNRWLNQYLEEMLDGIDEKIIRISGPLGVSVVTFNKEDIKPSSGLGYDISIESRIVSDSKRAQKLEAFKGFIETYVQSPGVLNMKYVPRKHAELIGMSKDEIEMLLPPSLDEMVASGENVLLSDNKLVPIAETDDHQVHIMIHARARQTKQLIAHIQAHKKALTLPRDHMIATGGTKVSPDGTSLGQNPGAPGLVPGQPISGIGNISGMPSAQTPAEAATNAPANSTPGLKAVIPGQ